MVAWISFVFRLVDVAIVFQIILVSVAAHVGLRALNRPRGSVGEDEAIRSPRPSEPQPGSRRRTAQSPSRPGAQCEEEHVR